MTSMFRTLSLLGLSLTLAACSGLREDLGLGRNPPDEFAVVDRPPLSLPPDFSLRPPQPGAPRPQEVDAGKQASEALFPEPEHAAPVSAAEKALLEATEADKADPTIRETVDTEAAQKVVATPRLVDALLSWSGVKEEKPATTVHAEDEAARIKAAKDKGEPVNSSPTPVIERGKSGWLGL